MYDKLFELRKQIKPLVKDIEGYNYQYFDINQMVREIQPILEKLKLVIIQPLTIIEGRRAIKTILVDVESGDKLEDATFLPDIEDPQKMGSAITYLRRYALQSMLFLEAEDDDGVKAKRNNARPEMLKPRPMPKYTEDVEVNSQDAPF